MIAGGLRTPFKRWLVAFSFGILLGAPVAQAEYADMVLNRVAEKAGMRPVIFSHWFHRIRFTCNVCHNDSGFKMRAGSNAIDMLAIIDGKFCGMCHNNNIAWGPERCGMCHSGLPGIPSGGVRGNEPGGPS